ncbi:hypothetical protein DL765_011640 [Monosporascus sp. GIB2]|nr:hypothetical protein DL765_011640 [Monosporascus sp. GIB2]
MTGSSIRNEAPSKEKAQTSANWLRSMGAVLYHAREWNTGRALTAHLRRNVSAVAAPASAPTQKSGMGEGLWYVGGLPVVERNHPMVATLFFFTTLAFSVVCLRLFTRIVLVRNVGADDCLMVAAMVGSIIYLTAVFQPSLVKFKTPLPGAGTNRFDGYEQPLIASPPRSTQLAVKFSILTQYKRIFETEAAKRLFSGLLIYLGCYAAFCLGSSILTCVPVAKYWDDAIPGGCLNRSNLHYGIAGVNIVNDFILLCIPYPFLRRLNISRRAKHILVGIFACGAVACIVAIIRLRSLFVNNSAPVDQQPVQGVDIALWSGLEINIAIACASVPQLKAMFVKVIPKLSTHSGSRTPYGTGASGSRGTHPHYRSGAGGKSVAGTTTGHDNDGEDPHERDKNQGGILVERAFEMQSMPAAEDGSEENLVASSWNVGCYSSSGGGRTPPTGGRPTPA